MGKRKKAHKQKVALRNAKLAADRKTAYFPNLTEVLTVSIRENSHLMSWEHLVQNLNVPSSSADINLYNLLNRTREGKVLNGDYIKTADDKFKIFMNPTGFSSHVYRGEKKEYKHFEPSLQRALCNKETEKIQKANNFIAALEKSPIYTYFKQPIKCGDELLTFDIDAEAIAQHYGFVSNYLDLTRDEDVAKFFAYSYVDGVTGRYKLVEDFEQYSPTLYKAHIMDIYSKYGCEPIGFQPFLRPIKQWALAVNLDGNYKGVKDLFEVYKLTDAVDAKRIFEKFKGGELLFPKEPVTVFIDKFSPNFSATMEWNADYVKYLLNWLIENIGWRGECPNI